MKEAMEGKKEKKMQKMYYNNLKMKEYMRTGNPLQGQGHLGGGEPQALGSGELSGAHDVCDYVVEMPVLPAGGAGRPGAPCSGRFCQEPYGQ